MVKGVVKIDTSSPTERRYNKLVERVGTTVRLVLLDKIWGPWIVQTHLGT